MRQIPMDRENRQQLIDLIKWVDAMPESLDFQSDSFWESVDGVIYDLLPEIPEVVNGGYYDTPEIHGDRLIITIYGEEEFDAELVDLPE